MAIQFVLDDGEKRVLAGQINGASARESLLLDHKDVDSEVYEVIIPERIFSINPSFFMSCFGKSIHKLGEFGFRNKYKFIGNEVIASCVDYGIKRAKYSKF